jgi:ferredoxin
VNVRVDSARCQGHGRCFDICPQVFRADEAGHASVATALVPVGFEPTVAKAAANCPEEAIEVSRS